MLAIHISHDSLKYAQLVNFKGAPFIESMGKVALKSSMLLQDMNNAEVVKYLADQIADIRNTADFPDSAAHLVIDSDWFPLLIHDVDSALEGNDLQKYLKWRISEMLETTGSQFYATHQELKRDAETGATYFSVCIPNSLDNWLKKISAPSELTIQNVILEIQALGDLIAASNQLDDEGGLQAVLENQDEKVRVHLFKDREFAGVFHATVNWDYKLTIDYARGDQTTIMQVREAIEKAIKGKMNPDNVLTNLFFMNSSGDENILNNLATYSDICKPLDLVHHFNFRDPDFENIDEYAVVLGALSKEIQERFSED